MRVREGDWSLFLRFARDLLAVGGLGSRRPEAGKANEKRTRLLEVEFLFYFLSDEKRR